MSSPRSSPVNPAESPLTSDGPYELHEGFAQVNGTRIRYVTGGSGPVVALVHGWPYTWVAWRHLLPHLVAKGYTVLATDLRGTGASDRPPTGYDKSTVADDIRQVARLLTADPINLVGMDIGAMVAYAYAADHPDEVRRLVLAESALPGFGLEDIMDPARGGSWHFGFHMQVDVADMLTTGHEAEYLGNAWGIGSLGGVTAEDRAEMLEEYSSPGGMRGGFQHYATLLEDVKTNQGRTSKLPMPVLVLNGDHGLPQQLLLGGVQRAAVNVHADTVPDSGHVFGADNPGWTARRLVAFFS